MRQVKRRLLCVCAVLLGLVGPIGCGQPTPIAPAPAPVPLIHRVTALTVTGRTQLSAIDDASQLTALATFADGTTGDVSSAASWASLDPSLATVSATGLVSAKALGVVRLSVTLSCSYWAVPCSLPQAISVVITITPPGTFTARGRVREPGAGPIQGVRVSEAASGQSALSNSEGEYGLGGLTSSHLTFEKEGYEPGAIDTKPNGNEDVSLQKIIRLAVADSASIELAPHDMEYAVSPTETCYPCRLFRITSTSAVTLHLRLAWTEPKATLAVWTGGQVYPGTSGTGIAVDLPIGEGEILVYVGLRLGDLMPGYVPLTLTTSVDASPAARPPSVP